MKNKGKNEWRATAGNNERWTQVANSTVKIEKSNEK